MSIAIEPAQKGDEEKLSLALHQVQEEDPTVIVEVSQELRQTIIHCQGELHLSVIKWKTGTYFQRPEREICKTAYPLPGDDPQIGTIELSSQKAIRRCGTIRRVIYAGRTLARRIGRSEKFFRACAMNINWIGVENWSF